MRLMLLMCGLMMSCGMQSPVTSDQSETGFLASKGRVFVLSALFDKAAIKDDDKIQIDECMKHSVLTNNAEELKCYERKLAISITRLEVKTLLGEDLSRNQGTQIFNAEEFAVFSFWKTLPDKDYQDYAQSKEGYLRQKRFIETYGEDAFDMNQFRDLERKVLTVEQSKPKILTRAQFLELDKAP